MLEQELINIGINEKEAKIYLATLELGQSTVQQVAQKAAVNRATAYFIIDALMQRGLVSSFYKGKKQYFIAADPERLLEILEQEKESIEKKKENLKKLLPQLQSLNNKNADKPVVKYYEGKEGILATVEEFTKSAKGKVYMAYSVDEVNSVFTPRDRERARARRINNKITTQVIYTYKNGKLENTPDGERRKVPFDKFPISIDIAIYDNKLRIASLKDRLAGIVIEDVEIANSLQAIMKLAWEGAEKYQ
ncbi:MAG: helix-turn-helix domain-containing protein [bacterium]